MNIWYGSRKTMPAAFNHKNHGHDVVNPIKSSRQAAEILCPGARLICSSARSMCVHVQPSCSYPRSYIGNAQPFCKPAQSSCSPAQPPSRSAQSSSRPAQPSGRLAPPSGRAKLHHNRIPRGFILMPMFHSYANERSRTSLPRAIAFLQVNVCEMQLPW